MGAYNPASKVPTPQIDRLAREGVRLTDAHSPSGVCSPTRYGLLTGRYAWRSALERGVLWGDSPCLIEPGRATVATILRDHGYRGPFGIDGFRWRDADGHLAVQPLCEINARLTFGHVARRFAERLGIARVELQVGHREIPDGPGIVPLPVA